MTGLVLGKVPNTGILYVKNHKNSHELLNFEQLGRDI